MAPIRNTNHVETFTLSAGGTVSSRSGRSTSQRLAYDSRKKKSSPIRVRFQAHLWLQLHFGPSEILPIIAWEPAWHTAGSDRE